MYNFNECQSSKGKKFGIFPTWLTVLQLIDENHKGINRAFAEVNVCLILLRDYVSCTHL